MLEKYSRTASFLIWGKHLIYRLFAIQECTKKPALTFRQTRATLEIVLLYVGWRVGYRGIGSGGARFFSGHPLPHLLGVAARITYSIQ